MIEQRPVVGFCEFIGPSALADLVEVASAADRCAAEAAAVLGRHGGSTERVLYDRCVVVFSAPGRAVEGFLELRSAIRALGFDLATGLADGGERTNGWGRAHIAARTLSQAAEPGEVLVDDRLRRRLGQAVRCEPAAYVDAIPAWRLLSGS
jgi:class 3 adenylate cyclase